MGKPSHHLPMPLSVALVVVCALALAALAVSCDDDSPTKSEENPYFTGLPMNRVDWQRSSRPYTIPHGYSHGRMLWHLPYDLPLRSEVYGDTTVQPQAELRVLRLIYRPSYQVFEFGGTIDTIFFPSWAGLMLETDKRFDTAWQYLEIRCKASGGRMHIELGRIDEDVDGDGESFGEDDVPYGDGNGVVSEAEDIGLDGLADIDEPGYDPMRNPDPNRDNWYFRNEGKCPYPAQICDDPAFHSRMEDPSDPIYYEWLNGTEGNLVDISDLFQPDQERLIGFFDTDNHYYSFLIDFDEDPDTFFVDGSEINGWRTYRIPIRDEQAAEDVVGNNMDFNRLTHARVWFDSDEYATGFDTVLVADWKFTE